MIPLNMTQAGESARVRRVGGIDQTRRHLNSLGFHEGSVVRLVSKLGGNVIVMLKASRVALSRELAARVMVEYLKEEGK